MKMRVNLDNFRKILFQKIATIFSLKDCKILMERFTERISM